MVEIALSPPGTNSRESLVLSADLDKINARVFPLGPHKLHRVGTFAMMSLYGLMVFIGLVCFIVR